MVMYIAKNKVMRIFALCAVCCTFGFAACSGGEDNIDDVLSKETTPVTFELGSCGEYILYDYIANGTYVGSNTIQGNGTATINLRQGKHQLIIVRGLDSQLIAEDSISFAQGIHFVPQNKSLIFNPYIQKTDTNFEYNQAAHKSVFYWAKCIEVSPHLLPTQKAIYLPGSCSVQIYLTDEYTFFLSNPALVGRITSIPVITEVGLDDKRYKINGFGDAIINIEVVKSGLGAYMPVCEFHSLCPLNGLNDIQLTTNIKDNNGQTVQTATLPKISFRRGYITKLTGPLFCGSTSDWDVEMIPYDYEY